VTTESNGPTLRRITGALFLIGAVAFATAATILSATFDWPDILREPADVVLTRFAAGGASLVWTWFATAWTYAILVVPILLLPTVLGRRDDAALWVATFAGAISVALALIGFLRWVFVVPPLAGMYQDSDAANRWRPSRGAPRAVTGDRLVGHSQHHHHRQSGAASLAGSRRPARQRALPVEQGDILATALPGFPVFDLAGLIGSTVGDCGWLPWASSYCSAQ
jgi:hypothetical protein